MGEFKNLRESVIHVKSGYHVIMNMTDIDSVPVPSVAWESNEGTLIRSGPKYFMTTKNQLVLLSVDETDSGNGFRVRATNPQIGKEEISAYTYLNVTGDGFSEIGPKIVIPLENQKAIHGKTVQFECIANARPLHEIEIHWFKDGVPIESTDIVHTFEWMNRTLILLSVDKNFNGQYECRLSMKTGGYNVVSSKATLTVLEPPAFTNSAQMEFVAEYSSRLEIPCLVTGYPEPFITWFRNADAIDLSHNFYRKRNDNTLVIEKVSLDDSGVFQCLASNEAGEKSAYAWIKVKSKFTQVFITFLVIKASIKLASIIRLHSKIYFFPSAYNEKVKLRSILRASNNFTEKFIRDKRLAQPRIILGDFTSSSNDQTVLNCKKTK